MFADPLITVLVREVVPRVRGKEKGDVLKGYERSAGEDIVGEEVGEGRDYGVAVGGVVGTGDESDCSMEVKGGQPKVGAEMGGCRDGDAEGVAEGLVEDCL